MRMLCWPFRSPFKRSNRFTGRLESVRISGAPSSMSSFRRAGRSMPLKRRTDSRRKRRSVSAQRKDRITTRSYTVLRLMSSSINQPLTIGVICVRRTSVVIASRPLGMSPLVALKEVTPGPAERKTGLRPKMDGETSNEARTPPKLFSFTHFPKNTSANPLVSHTFKTKDLKPFRFTHLQKSGGGALRLATVVIPSEPAILADDEGLQRSESREPQPANRKSPLTNAELPRLSHLTSTLTKNVSATPLTSTLTKTKDLKSFRINTYKKEGGVPLENRSKKCRSELSSAREDRARLSELPCAVPRHSFRLLAATRL